MPGGPRGPASPSVGRGPSRLRPLIFLVEDRKLTGKITYYVSEIDIRTDGSMVHVSFEGGKAEQEKIEHIVREAGYEIFKASHRERER